MQVANTDQRKHTDIPRSQTWNLMLLYCTVSTLNPIAARTKTKINKQKHIKK